MNKLQSTVRSILNQHSNLLINQLRPTLFLGPALFFFLLTSSAQAVTKIALIDTGFCPEKMANVSLNAPVDLTESVKIDCRHENLKSPRLHGQYVLLEFLSHLDSNKTKVEIFPLIVFDHRGLQKKIYWEKAIAFVKEKKIDVVVSAAGLPMAADEKEALPKKLPGVWFVPSGRIGPGIKETTQLFPQSLAPLENLFLIGDYYDGKMILFDEGLLYKDQIDYFFPSGKGDFKGTSRAVAEASAKALTLCPLTSLSTFRACLRKHSKVYVDGLNQKKIKTY